MKQEKFVRMLAEATPEVPEQFHCRVEAALAQATAGAEQHRRTARPLRRALAIGLAAALLLSAAALAAVHWRVFDSLPQLLGIQPTGADRAMQGDLHRETVNGVEITVREAGYDGRTLLLQYTYRMPGVAQPLGEVQEGSPLRLLTQQELQLPAEHGVGWWIDHFWVNGQCVDMAPGSGSVAHGSDSPGEIVQTEYWRLDHLALALEGELEIALPIGERQPLADYSLREHPERYGPDGQLLKPAGGLVTFTLDVGDPTARNVELPTGGETHLPDCTVRVEEAVLTPLLTYITLSMEPDAQSMEAYLAANGPGFCAEDGTLLWPYTGADVYGGRISSMQLVDGQGRVLFPEHWGNQGYDESWAEFVFPYLDARTLPGQLWLAPVVDGVGDMSQAVQVK